MDSNGSTPATEVRRRPQQDRSADKVTAILRAAREQLQRVDLADVTVRTVAAAAGVSSATVYRYFADLDEVVDALLVEHLDASEAALGAALRESRSRTVAGVFDLVLRTHLELYAARPELVVAWRSPALVERQRRIEQAADRGLATVVGRHLEAVGAIDRLTPQIAKRLVTHWAAAGAVLDAVLRAEPPLRAVLADDLAALVRHAAGRYA